jgi:hypothetical protein
LCTHPKRCWSHVQQHLLNFLELRGSEVSRTLADLAVDKTVHIPLDGRGDVPDCHLDGSRSPMFDPDSRGMPE